jgi:cell division protein FtsQ
MATTERERHRQVLPWAVAGGSALILAAAIVSSSYLPWFHAHRITVKGERHLSRGQVLRIAGLSESTNVVHADLAAAERRLRGNPWVADATVTRDLPDALGVALTERVAVAVVAGEWGPTLVAADGTLLGAATHMPRYPLIQGDAVPLPPGSAAISAGARLVAALGPPLRTQVTTVTVSPEMPVRVDLESGVTVTYGEADELEAKAQALRAVLAWAEQHGEALSTIDLTVPNAPTARVAGGAQVEP